MSKLRRRISREMYAGLVQQMIEHQPKTIVIRVLFHQLDQTSNGVVPQT